MTVFYFLAAFLLIRRLVKRYKLSLIYPKWASMLSTATWVIIVIYIGISTTLDHWAADILGAAILLGLLQYVDREPDFDLQKPYLQANYPLVAIGFINGLAQLMAENFYEKYSNYFQLATLAAFVWIFSKFANSNKQEEALRLAAERKAELEALVSARTAELVKQKENLQEIVEELKATQDQLIQSEKMASLGELTAGIAHEIQNPLNFVNNFSEVSMELIEEMTEELEKGDKEEAIAIASDIKQNLEKIRHHGQRADGIVKGMLQHSRASSTTKEPTDINKLADEYMRLSYHGLRAKDKSFNANLEMNLAENLPLIDVVPQDIGRVLLNMFNNAFYAVQQKSKTHGAEFKPTVAVTTTAQGTWMVITVRDNGTGIPDAIKEKIMQPFFTTKPTGEGTGLGLSLSYDIVVKAHGGKIDIDSKEGEYTEFTIKLPLK
ncbi:sensor histidine kinase [Mucilaginibacter sp. L3T2-6]|uniref:sensor histidine kinase n=1 Tax=Mucilaginibacter sp. L3T2-6 TaxID=3062491 RepID=UPI0026746791|nr:ATP-binding protein [Mucilaginibacter sp. L3T2-6]MDO3643230.1 ATP-binding protein [Mucilaginibacter sp. L3T2-6]MDV6215554.1 ATP-binding protein [Mucilaginibacter sp. L3T2-6]